MEDPPPENPDSLTTHVKERHFGQPESLVSGGKRNEARPRQTDDSFYVRLDRRLVSGWQ
jgi:hypothetical protein